MNFLRTQVHDFRDTLAGYPPAFRIIFYGSLVQAAGVSMIWPFLTVYMRESLAVAVTTITLLITMENIIGSASTSISGMVVDRFGRKTTMVISMGVSGVILALMGLADSLWMWVVLMAVRGVFEPMFGVGSSATVADMIPDEQRSSAYALLRISHNIGVAVGPAVGGLLIAISYAPVFAIGALVTLGFCALVAKFVPETLPKFTSPPDPLSKISEGETKAKANFGYGEVLKDRQFMLYAGIFTLTVMTYLIFMMLLPVYMKDEYGLPESSFGVMMTINALMVVAIEFGLTKWVSRRFKLEHILATAALCYAITMLMIAGSTMFIGFLLAAIVLTVGEILMMPNSTTYVANVASAEMRGRYMGVYSLTWRVGGALGPLMGGLINDNIAPVAVWIAAAGFSGVAVAGFLYMARRPVPIVNLPEENLVVMPPVGLEVPIGQVGD